jgi:HEPN domain-containing protein
MRRSEDWLRQAERDLQHAVLARDNGDYEWACFAAHQAAEKALKALLQSEGIDVWGHSVTQLLGGLPSSMQPTESLFDKAKELDRHYIPARYPDAHPEGAPMDYYTEKDADRAVAYSREVIDFVKVSL